MEFIKINFDNLKLIWKCSKYYNALYEFKNPKSFLLEAHFKVIKKQSKQKITALEFCLKKNIWMFAKV